MKFLPSFSPSQPPPFLFNYLFGHPPILKERDKNKIILGSNSGTNSSHLLLLCICSSCVSYPCPYICVVYLDYKLLGII